MRAERITSTSDNCYILTETKTQNIFKQIEAIEPEIVIIDSIQTLHTDYIESTAGSISQIRETTAELIKFAKETNIPYSYWPYYQRREQPAQKYWNIWLTPFYSLKATEITYRILRSLKSIWFHSRNWHLRNVRKRFT
jgi:sugar/nucleoside kinase (ribokinase family)